MKTAFFYTLLASMFIVLIVKSTTALFDQEQKIKSVDARIGKAERTLVMLHTCFPNATYKEDAAPACPAFRVWLNSELDKNEAAFTEGK